MLCKDCGVRHPTTEISIIDEDAPAFLGGGTLAYQMETSYAEAASTGRVDGSGVLLDRG